MNAPDEIEKFKRRSKELGLIIEEHTPTTPGGYSPTIILGKAFKDVLEVTIKPKQSPVKSRKGKK